MIRDAWLADGRILLLSISAVSRILLIGTTVRLSACLVLIHGCPRPLEVRRPRRLLYAKGARIRGMCKPCEKTVELL